MKIPCKEYLLTHSIQETLDALSASQGTARVVAGGTDLLLDLQQGNHPPVNTLIDVTEVGELRAIEIREGSLFIGASVTHSRLKDSGLVKIHAQAVAEAASLMATPLVCNVATIGGNVAHALPAADGTIALLAMDAQAEIASLDGRRRVSLQELFKGPGESALDPCGDLLVGFFLPLVDRGTASSFTRRVNPQGIALAVLNLAVWLQRKDSQVEAIRIAIGPSGPVPRRMKVAEEVYRGQVPTAEVHAQALEALLNEAQFRTSRHRATAEYRCHLAGIMLDETFRRAWQRAGLNGD